MNQRVVMIGLAGDSAAGKTTLSRGLVEALGAEQVTAISSDHYHRYNRKTRERMGISALAPAGNYIDIMEQHFKLLRQGQAILMPIYNHTTGDFDPPVYVKPKKYVIIEGLLPFHTPRLRLEFDLKVYLDPPETLRRAWKLMRDTAVRGYTEAQVLASLEKRRALSPRYIHPQKKMADIIVRFSPPEHNAEETGGRLNAQLVLKPTVPQPDLADVLEQGGSGTDPALRLDLARYEGAPADFLEIAGSATPAQAHTLIGLIQRHMPPDSRLDEEMLGRYQSGLVEKRSLPLALTQHLIAYHMVTAALALDELRE